MRLPNDKTKFTAQFKYVELGRYIPNLDRITREMNNGEPALFEIQDIPAYAARYNNLGIYTSVFQYDNDDLHKSTPLGPVYFDLDADDAEISKGEALKLVEHLLRDIPESAVRLYFSGQKGFHVECHPGDQKILTREHGYVRIEELDESVHRLVAYDKNKDRIRRLKNSTKDGGKFSRSSRMYKGKMLSFNVSGKTFQCTPNHHLTVSWNDRARKSYAVYLMQRSGRWRIGVTKLFTPKGSPRIKVRMHEENADSIWILGLFDSQMEALVHETLWSFRFGIPQIVFVPSRYYPKNKLTDEQASYIFEGLDTDSKIDTLFDYFELDKTLPFRSRTSQGFGGSDIEPLTKRFMITAANFIPRYMEMATDNATQKPKWTDDIEMCSSDFYGEVYNIAMETYHHYIASGTAVHNCEPIALGITPTDEPSGLCRFIGEDLKQILDLQTLDFKVYDQRRMWRLPNSRHQRSGLYKVDCMQLCRSGASLGEIKKYAENPQSNEVPEQVFDSTANQWYREYFYRFEQSRLKRNQYDPDMVSRFLTEGASNIKHYDGERMFDKAGLLKNCSAIRELAQKARTDHYLDHYERLFLCSILTYNEEAIQFLHEILAQCSDYNFEISRSHIDDWMKRREYEIGGRPFTCQKAAEVGISCSDCDKMEPRKKVVRLDSGNYIETNEISMPSPIRLAYFSKTRRR